MKFSSSKGNIEYSKVGSGPHLCFLHGFCEHSGLWADLVSRLRSDYSCLLIDLPGFGSSHEASFDSIGDMANLCLELLADQGWEDCQLFGHSMGGYLALEMMSKQAFRFNSLGLIHSTAYADSEEKKKSRLKVIRFVESQGAETFLKQFYPALVAADNLNSLNAQLWELVRGSKQQGILSATKAMMERQDHSELLAQIKTPVLFISGDQDQHFPKEDILKQAAVCNQAQLSIIQDVGHLSILEAPQKLYEVFVEFLEFKNNTA